VSTETSTSGDREKAREVVKYLRDEADFNRSYIDGRRPRSHHAGYDARRRELAEQREAWADAIERLAGGQ